MTQTLGYVRKKHATEIEESPWGLHYVVRQPSGPYPHDHLIDLMGRSGAKWSRFILRWPFVETEKGHYDWSLFDTAVEGLTERGVNLFIGSSASSNRLYHDVPEGYWYPPVGSPDAMAGYLRYMTTMVERYRDRVRHYEIWNEPNIKNFWRPEPDAANYAYLVRETAAAMHAVDSDIQVIGGVLAGVGEAQSAFARDFLSDGNTADAVDILTYHPYNPTPEVTLEDIRALREAVHAIKPGMPLWQGECGCPSSGDTIHYRGNAPWGYNVQAKWLLRRLLTDYLADAEVAIYFLIAEFYRHRVNGDPTSPMGFNTKGLVQGETWQPKPAYYAFQNLASAIDSTWQRVDERAGLEIVDPGIFYGIGPHEERFPCVPWQIVLKRQAVPMLVTWLPWQPQELVEPATVRVDWPGVSWTEPVCVDLLTGAVREAGVVGGGVEVPLADYPMLLTELAALDVVNEPQQPAYWEMVGKLRWTYATT